MSTWADDDAAEVEARRRAACRDVTSRALPRGPEMLPMAGGPSTLRADAQLIDVGTWLRHRTVVLEDDPTGKILGIVCHVEQRQWVDDDGEVTDTTVYRVRDPNARAPLAYTIAYGADIDPEGCWNASLRDVARLVRRVCFEIGRSKTRTGIAVELRMPEVDALADLLAVLAATL